MPTKASPAPKPPSKVAGVADAIESLERRRKAPAHHKPAARRGDLDLNGIR